MNQRLAETDIRTTCRELLAHRPRLSGRELCAQLRTRFGAVGKTERVFRIWREEVSRASGRGSVAAAAVPPDAQSLEIAALRRRLAAAEAAAAAQQARADLAEYRERAHQDHWALEVDRLRQELRALRT